jgi:hypothetical protein
MTIEDRRVRGSHSISREKTRITETDRRGMVNDVNDEWTSVVGFLERDFSTYKYLSRERSR